MRFKDIIGLGIALVLAVGVAFLTRFFLAKKEEPKQEIVSQQQQQQQQTKVLVTTKTLQEGDKLKSGDLVWQPWPLNALNQNYVTEQVLRSHSMKLEDLTGAVVRELLNQGEPVVIKDFVKPGDRSILAAILAPGKRAISIEVSPTTASSGLINPGDLVDIILSFTSTSSGAEGLSPGKSQTLLKEIKVLAIDTDLSPPQGKINASPRVATLEVTPDQAEILVGSTKNGTLSLSLHGLSKSNDLPVTSEETVSHNIPQETKIIIMRGKETSTVEFKENK